MGAVPPRSFSVPLPPCPRAQGLGLSGHQGEPSSQRQSRGGGGWAEQGVFCFSQADSPARGGWGRCQDPQLQPPPWEAPSQLQSLNTQRQWKQEGREEGVPSQTKAPNPTPGLSSFLQVLFFDPLKPSKEVQRSLTLWGEGGGVLEGTCNTSTGVFGLALHQKPQQISHSHASSGCKSLHL